MYFKNKYIKYKNKYLALKKQIGGAAAGKYDGVYIRRDVQGSKRKAEDQIVNGIKQYKTELPPNILNFNMFDKLYKTRHRKLEKVSCKDAIYQYLLVFRDCDFFEIIPILRDLIINHPKLLGDVPEISRIYNPSQITPNHYNLHVLNSVFINIKERFYTRYNNYNMRNSLGKEHEIVKPPKLKVSDYLKIFSVIGVEKNNYKKNMEYGYKKTINNYYRSDNIINNAFGSNRILINNMPYFCMRVVPEQQYNSSNHISIVIKIKLDLRDAMYYTLNIKLFKNQFDSNAVYRKERTIEDYHDDNKLPSQYIGFSNFDFDDDNYGHNKSSEFSALRGLSYIDKYCSDSVYSYLFLKIMNPYNICSGNYKKIYNGKSERILNIFYSERIQKKMLGDLITDEILTSDMINKGEHLVISNKLVKMISISRVIEKYQDTYVYYTQEKGPTCEIEPNVLRRILFYLSTGEKSFAVKVIGHSNNNGDEEFYNQHIKDKLNIDIHSIVNRYCDTFTDTLDKSDVIYSPYVGKDYVDKDINEQKLTNNQINASKVYVPPIPVNFACQL
jgi:hypothetical protein